MKKKPPYISIIKGFRTIKVSLYIMISYKGTATMIMMGGWILRLVIGESGAFDGTTTMHLVFDPASPRSCRDPGCLTMISYHLCHHHAVFVNDHTVVVAVHPCASPGKRVALTLTGNVGVIDIVPHHG